MEFKNPLRLPEIELLLAEILNVVIIISLPIIVFFLIYAGFMYVTARGNPEKLQAASRSLMYGIVGAVIILGSIAIVAIVKSTVTAF